MTWFVSLENQIAVDGDEDMSDERIKEIAVLEFAELLDRHIRKPDDPAFQAIFLIEYEEG